MHPSLAFLFNLLYIFDLHVWSVIRNMYIYIVMTYKYIILQNNIYIIYLKYCICGTNIYLDTIFRHNNDGRSLCVRDSDAWPRPWCGCACAPPILDSYFEIRARKLFTSLRYTALEEAIDNSSSLSNFDEECFFLITSLFRNACR